ncbi:MAG: hypothetical protein KDB79_15570 [Acidobacteria bacterium]|nr:hypothetical protein [Acidobacteriota bacterium]
MKSSKVNVLLVLSLVIGIGIGCSLDTKDPNSSSQNDSEKFPKKLDNYEIKGFKFAYYQIPKGLSREELLKVAQAIHEMETDTQLILVDDDSKVAEYIKYVKAISGSGEIDEPLPQEWADKHIIANVQKYMNGRWVLCESNGSKEIADLK